MNQSRQPSAAAQIVETSSDSGGADGVPETRRSGVRLHNAHQSVVTQTLNNAQSINFVNQGASTGLEGFNQSIHASKVDIQGGVTYKTKNFFHVSEYSTIPDWIFSLSPLRFEETQNENTQTTKKGHGAGQWLLESAEFIGWRDGESRRLWCHGIPGAGKTVLASIVVNHLQTGFRFVSNNIVCIYVYFDYRDQKRQNLTNLLSSLLAQLVRNRDQISQEVKEIHQAWKSKGMYPSSDEYLQMLKSQIKLFSKVFIVVDALDECLNDHETNTTDEFLKVLRLLPRTVHFLFTSRPDMSIRDKIQPDSELEIVATNSDLRKYLENRINSREHLKLLVDNGMNKDKFFLEKVLDAIVGRSHGMFLLAQLHMDFLASKYTLEDFQSGIVNLPQTPNEVYRISLERISCQGEFKRSLAIRVLTWLVFAERPLTIAELIHTLAVRVGDKSLHEERFVTEKTVSSACAGIVIVDQGTDVVRLAHNTAEKYLRDNESTIFKDAQSIMAETCLVYLSFEEFSQVLGSQDEVADRRKRYPFLSYAADHWGDHVSSRVRGRVYRLACEFLSAAPKVMSAFQVMGHFRFRFEIDVTGMHVAAYFGLDKLAKKLLERGFAMDARTQRGETALHWAAFYGQRRFLEVLIHQGADLNVKDIDGRTALHKAIINEDVFSVELLLSSERRIDLNLEDSQRWTALRWAAAYGQMTIVEMLLRSKAEVDAQDKDGWTALRWAAQRGHKRIVELLIRSGASVELPSSDQWTLLRWAAQEGRDPFIRLLIEKRAKLNATDSNGWTALRWAIDYGHGMAAWLLMQARANINKPDNKGLTPLHSAAERWQESSCKSLIWLLLENGAEINAQTKLGLTALHIAATQGHSSVVWLLLENGANINAQTKLGLTALHIAATRGHSSVVWLLLEKGANPRQGDNNRRTPLHCAIIEGHEAEAQLLIQKAEGLIHATDDEKRTALHIAASAGNLSIVVLLLNYGAQIDTRDRERCTPLHCAVSQQHQNVVLCLTNRGADVNMQNKKGWVALHSAAYAGNTTIIKTILQSNKADTTIENNDGQTPWELAKCCNYDIEKF